MRIYVRETNRYFKWNSVLCACFWITNMVFLDNCICSVNNRYFMVHWHSLSVSGLLGDSALQVFCNPVFVLVYINIYITYVRSFFSSYCLTVCFFLLFEACIFVEKLVSIYPFSCFNVNMSYQDEINQQPTSYHKRRNTFFQVIGSCWPTLGWW